MQKVMNTSIEDLFHILEIHVRHLCCCFCVCMLWCGVVIFDNS